MAIKDKYVAAIRVVLQAPTMREARYVTDWIVDKIKTHWSAVKEVTVVIESPPNGHVETRHD